MCGIIGYVGPRECRDLLLEGLQRLEYRGYDSAGLSLVANGAVGSVHAVGNLQHLRDAVAKTNGHLRGSTGIGHTRWATHGRVTEANAHPHWDTSGRVHIVLNGIVENWTELRDRLARRGRRVHLRDRRRGGRPPDRPALRRRPRRGRPARLQRAARPLRVRRDVGRQARRAGRRAQGVPARGRLGEGESFIASAIPAFLAETRRVQLVKDGEIVEITPEGSRFLAPRRLARSSARSTRSTGTRRPPRRAATRPSCSRRSTSRPTRWPRRSPAASARTASTSDDIGISDEFLRDVRRVVIVACGTSYHAGLVGRYAIEWWARRPVEMDVASEFRYRNPVLDERDLVIGISQSGETADTLAAMRLARERGAKVLAITNIMGSQATRDSDGVLFTRAGLEIGVAATKTFVAQVAAMYLFALKLAELHGTLEPEVPRGLMRRPARDAAPDHTAGGRGRRAGAAHRRALEGRRLLPLPRPPRRAADLPRGRAQAQGDLLHPDRRVRGRRDEARADRAARRATPVVCVATDSPVLDKVLSNIAEVRARGAHVVAVATEGSGRVAETPRRSSRSRAPTGCCSRSWP